MALRLSVGALAMVLAMSLHTVAGLGGAAQAAGSASKTSIVCKTDDAPADAKSKGKAGDTSASQSDDADEGGQGVTFPMAGACAKVTAGVSYTYQQAKQSAPGIPTFVNMNGTLVSGSSSNTLSAHAGLDTSRQTSVGEVKTTTAVSWSKATGDGTQYGTTQITGWSVALANDYGTATVGYISTLMSFWTGNFLTTANSPARNSNSVNYEYTFEERFSLAAGMESSLPTSPDTYTGIKSVDLSEPVYTLRARYETEDWMVHLSGLARRADFTQSPLLPRFPNTAAVRLGWGLSAGLKGPVPFTGEDDTFNVQVTYTSDASAYLGINTDLVVYQHTVRSEAPVTGWSMVAGYHHVWSEQFESNAFASYVRLNAHLLLASPDARSLRTGVNLFWKPTSRLKFGIEFGTVTMNLAPHGIEGLFSGGSGHSYIGAFSVSAEL